MKNKKVMTIVIVLAVVIVAMAYIGCKVFCPQPLDKWGMVYEGDSVTAPKTADSITEAGIDKHSEAYIRQRLDTIYSNIRQRVTNETDDNHPYMDSGFNPDSAYCSSLYYGLLKQATDITNETGDIVFDYEHWVCGQDFSQDWNYQIQEVYDITDSTAMADLTVINFDNKIDVTLSLVFERGDWYINEFGSEDSEGSDKTYFRRLISDGLKAREKAKTLVGEWCWVGDDCPELILNLEMTDHWLKAGQCDVYRLYGFDKTGVTFDGDLLSVTEYEYDDKAMKTVRDFSLYVRLNEHGDLTGTCRIKHPLASKEYNGPITLRKGYFKYRDDVKSKLSNYAE